MKSKHIITQKRLLFILLLLASVCGVLFINLNWTDGDEGRYTCVAKSIASGKGQSELYLPTIKPEWLSPPIYPYALAIVYKLTDGNISALKALSLLFFLLFTFIFCKFIFHEFPFDSYSVICICVLSVLNVYILSHAWLILSETAYLFSSFLAIAFFYKTERKKSSYYSIVFLTGLLAGISMLIRPIGLALVLAGFCHYAIKKDLRALFVYGSATLLINIPTIIRTQIITGVPFAYMVHYADYAGQSGSSLTVMFNTIRSTFTLLPKYIFAIPSTLFFSLLSDHCLLCKLHMSYLVKPFQIIVTAILTLGFASYLRRPRIIEFYWVFYWLLTSTYNQPNYMAENHFFLQHRYIICMIPIAALYLVKGLETIYLFVPFRKLERMIPSKHLILSSWTVYTICIALFAGACRTRHELKLRGLPPWHPYRQEYINTPASRAFGRYLEAATWIKGNLPETVVIASRKPEHTFLLSNKKSFRYDFGGTGCSSIWEIMTNQARHGSVIILQDAFPEDTGYGRDRITMLDPAIKQNQNKLKLLFETANPTTRVWQVIQESY